MLRKMHDQSDQLFMPLQFRKPGNLVICVVVTSLQPSSIAHPRPSHHCQRQLGEPVRSTGKLIGKTRKMERSERWERPERWSLIFHCFALPMGGSFLSPSSTLNRSERSERSAVSPVKSVSWLFDLSFCPIFPGSLVEQKRA